MVVRWVVLLTLVAAATAALTLLGAPAPYLLGALVAGLLLALTSRAPRVPDPAVTAGQAVIGVSVGLLITPRLLGTFAENGVVLGAALVATLAISLAWGQVLRLQPGVSPVTASFASIAGGASGVVATAREAGADEPVVATMQYLRVLVILFTMPLIAGLAAPDAAIDATGSGTDAALTVPGLLFTALALALGLGLVRLRPFPGAAVLLPMLASAGLAAGGWFARPEIPAAVLYAGYAVIGVQVGVKFTPATVRLIARLLPLAAVQVVGTVGSCAAIGYLMAATTDIGQLDAYLATTPGGLYAVVAVALSTGGDSGLVFTLQVLRLMVALLMVPLLARVFRAADPPR